jgi:transposase-like protein
MLYVRFPLSLRNVEDLFFERGYDLCHETVRLWWNRFGPMFAGEIRTAASFPWSILDKAGSSRSIASTMFVIIRMDAASLNLGSWQTQKNWPMRPAN